MDRYAFAERARHAARARTPLSRHRLPRLGRLPRRDRARAARRHGLGARTALAVLRERHTALDAAVRRTAGRPDGLHVALLVRSGRPPPRPASSAACCENASTLRSRAMPAPTGGSGSMSASAGIDMTLVARAEPAGRSARPGWTPRLDDRVPPPIGVYEGRGGRRAADSWVRAVIRGESRSPGLVEIDGVRHRLLPAEPRSARSTTIGPSPGGASRRRRRFDARRDAARRRTRCDAPPALGGARPGASGGGRGAQRRPGRAAVDRRRQPVRSLPRRREGLAAALNDLNVADGIYRGFGFVARASTRC